MMSQQINFEYLDTRLHTDTFIGQREHTIKMLVICSHLLITIALYSTPVLHWHFLSWFSSHIIRFTKDGWLMVSGWIDRSMDGKGVEREHTIFFITNGYNGLL